MNQTITILIPDDLKEGLHELSINENKAVSDIVRDSLKRYLAIHRFRRLRGSTLPFAESQLLNFRDR
ncbi:MAG: CopG family transcriptional regulator [Deltaproteobacteria bacterium CG23_combo_of_CG06-09_8_20_14_all_51_20]|nr:MAG: CopG family transcriptional regulator [Deltaproteobacteria bacterium CG23_combo_of_CG06-09_8_20_14_all_51_20]